MGLKSGNYGEANIVKTTLINLLLQDERFDLIANEVPFLYGKRTADLVAIKDGMLIGFEIKSKRDNLRTMRAQLEDYQRVFNKVYLVYSNKFASAPEIMQLSKSIGLMIVDEERNKLKRKASLKVNLDKKSLISVLWRKDLENLIKKSNSIDFDMLKFMVTHKCSTKQIQSQIVKSLEQRYGYGYELFLHELGERAIVEDLTYITGVKKHQIVF